MDSLEKEITICGVLFLDVISNLERIADHVTNFAQVVLGEVKRGVACEKEVGSVS